MGSSTYSDYGYRSYAQKNDLKTKSKRQTFKQTSLHKEVDPRYFNKDVRYYLNEVPDYIKACGVRKSCTSDAHPSVTDIDIFFDVTGSMGDHPHNFIREQFPNLMNKLYEAGVPDPQLAVGGIGDDRTDEAPLQFTQHDPSAEALLPQVQNLWLEGGGGGNHGESYGLAYHTALYHDECDTFFQTGKKGFLFTVGDEPCHRTISGESLDCIFGYDRAKDENVADLLEKVRERYHVFHIHVTDSYGENTYKPAKGWEKLIGKEHLILCTGAEISDKIVECVVNTLKKEDKSVSPATDDLVETLDKDLGVLLDSDPGVPDFDSIIESMK